MTSPKALYMKETSNLNETQKLMLYHGSRPSGTNIGKDGPIYLTPSPDTASHYASVNSRGEVDAETSGGVYPVYATIEMPLDMRPLGTKVTLEDFNLFLEDAGVNYQFRSTHYWQDNRNSIWLYFSKVNQPFTDSFFSKVKQHYDSIIFFDDSSTYGDPSGLAYIVFDSSQLVSALGVKSLKEASYKTLQPMLGKVYKQADAGLNFFYGILDNGIPFSKQDIAAIDYLMRDSERSGTGFGGFDLYTASELDRQLRHIQGQLLPTSWRNLRLVDIARGYDVTELENARTWFDEALTYIPRRVGYYLAMDGSTDEGWGVADVSERISADDDEAIGWSSSVSPYLSFLDMCSDMLSPIIALISDSSERVNRAYREHERKSPDRDPRPQGVQEQEVAWHATTAYREILSGGFKTRDEVQGKSALGGGPSNLISFTADYEVAEGIKIAILELVYLLNKVETVGDLVDFVKEQGIDPELRDWVWKRARKVYPVEGNMPAEEEYTTPVDQETVLEWYKGFLYYAEEEGVRYNPVFWGATPEAFKDLDTANVDIVEATIQTNAETVEYLASMEEWRVPKSAILSYGEVGSQ